MDFTRDAILARLSASYAGPGSAAEGSFAGEVLRACADALAELYAMEIDGLSGRAFVSLAVGDDLTGLCADRGVARLEGESDAALRSRTLARLAALPASGNADHYTAWCTVVPGILRVRVLPLARGNGTVDILAVGDDGRAAGAALLAAAQAAVDEQRPVGADARVLAPAETALNVSATVALMDGAEADSVRAAFAAALSAFCAENALRSTVVSYAKVSRLLLDCQGVADVSAFTLQGGTDSVTLDDRAVPVPGTLTLTEAGARLPDFLKRISPVGETLAAMEAGAEELRAAAAAETARVCVRTADEAGLALWEEDYALSSAGAVLERRRRILAALSGGCTVTPSYLKSLCETLTDADWGEVDERFGDWAVEILAVSEAGVIANVEALRSAVSRLMPAHLQWSVTACGAVSAGTALRTGLTGGVTVLLAG